MVKIISSEITLYVFPEYATVLFEHHSHGTLIQKMESENLTSRTKVVSKEDSPRTCVVGLALLVRVCVLSVLEVRTVLHPPTGGWHLAGTASKF